MKKLFLFLLTQCVVLLACNPSEADAVRGFIPGVYTKEINDEFTKGMDTLSISILDYESGSYSFLCHTSYRQSIDGKLLSPKTDIHKMTAIFIAETLQLKEQNQGKVFSFSPRKNLLSTGGSEYRKVD